MNKVTRLTAVSSLVQVFPACLKGHHQNRKVELHPSAKFLSYRSLGEECNEIVYVYPPSFSRDPENLERVFGWYYDHVSTNRSEI